MGKHKDSKKHKKGSQFVIRVDKAERDAFVKLCDALDTSAAREIRRFMREWVALHSAASDVALDAAASSEAQIVESDASVAVTPNKASDDSEASPDPADVKPKTRRKKVAKQE